MSAVAELKKEPMMKDSKTPSEGVQEISPKLAAYWLANYNYERQRKIRPWHVKNLTQELAAGRFLEKTAIHFCRVGGDYFLVNGQHTLSAVVANNEAFLLSVVVYECDSMEQVAEYFSRFDTHLTRQLSDALHAHQVDEHFGITKSQLQWVTAASIYYAYMTRELPSKSASQITHDQKLNLVLHHGEPTIQALRISEGHFTKPWVVRRTSLASIRILNDFDSTEAFVFWRGVVEDDGLKQGDPRKVLVDLFKQATTSGGTFTAVQKRKLPDAAWVKAIAVAWNAHVEGRALTMLRLASVYQAREVQFSKIGTFRV